MPHRPLEDWEMPDPDDVSDDGSFDDVSADDAALELVPCPRCGNDIYEEAERCNHCGEYITRSTSVLAGQPWWFVLLAVAGIGAVIASTFTFAL